MFPEQNNTVIVSNSRGEKEPSGFTAQGLNSDCCGVSIGIFINRQGHVLAVLSIIDNICIYIVLLNAASLSI